MDPLPEPATRVMLPPNSTETVDVTDFKFSPNGQFIAYRMGTGLHIAQAPAWLDQAIEFSGSPTVTRYAWSQDSAVLAVAFTLGVDIYLSGVDVNGAESASGGGGAGGAGGAPSNAGGTGTAGFTVLAPTMAPVDSELVWFQGNYVAFHVGMEGFPNSRLLYYSQLSTSGFLAPLPTDVMSYGSLLELRGVQSGLFVIDGFVGVHYYQVDPLLWADHGTDVIAPSGDYTGRVQDTELRLFRAIDQSYYTTDPPWATGSGCPRLLSWAQTADRVACLDSSVAPPAIRIFDLQNATQTLMASVVTGDYAYLDAEAAVWRRALSARGRWLAFTNPTYLYLADLQSTSSPLLFSHTSGTWGTAPAELAFSADERFLLHHRGDSLWLHSLELPSAPPIVVSAGQSLDPPVQCGQEFAPSPSNWCGNLRNPTPFVWAADSRFAAYRTAGAAGTLQVLNLSGWDFNTSSGSFDQIPVASLCGGPCIGQFEFQP
jgi:hypothetical protein